MITFTKEQLSEVMCKHAEKENGLHDLLEIMLESLMVAERSEFLHEQEDHNKGNGYRFGHTLWPRPETGVQDTEGPFRLHIPEHSHPV